MQAPAIRHDGLERMIRAFRFFAALIRRVRDSSPVNHAPVMQGCER